MPLRLAWPWVYTGTNKKAPKPEDPAFEHDRQALMQDIQQMKRVNEYLLAKAIARGWINSETAEAIRTTQAYESEVLKLGPDAQPPS